jgi:hypothetical protein
MTTHVALLLIFIAAALGCLIAGAVVLVRALKPFSVRVDTTKTQLQCIDIEKGRADIQRIQLAAEKAGKLRSELGI